MAPAIDGKVKVGGEVSLYPEFWKKLQESIYSSLFFDKLEQSLEGAKELPWYDIREYKLDTARTNELIDQFPGRGDCIRVLSYTGLATIKFDSPSNPSFNLNTYEKIRWGFNKLYLTNTTQAGKEIEILFAKGDFGLKKAIQPIEPFGELANENLAVLTDWTKIADELIIARHVAAHVIDANKLNVATHILSGATWTNNSPAAGSIAWTGAKVTYNGHTYTIVNGNTDKAYIWWDFSLSTTTFQVSDTKPTLADDDFIAVYNDSGTHILIWNATLIDGRVIRTGSIIANDILLSGATTLADWRHPSDLTLIAGGQIFTHSVEANKLNIARHIVSGAVWANNDPVAGKISWADAEVTYNGHTYSITDGNTDKAYIWWDFSLSTTTFQVSDTKPTLADDDFIVAYNDSGTHILIWNATLIDGRVIRTGSIIANDILLSGATTLADWRHPSDLTLIAGGQIFTHSVEANKLSILRHILSGATWLNNSPVGGKVAWSGAKLTYNGHTYTITNGNTDKKYIWWDFSLSVTTFQTSDTKPTLADQDCIVVYNDSGTHILVWNATLIDGRTMRTGTVTADEINVPGLDGSGIIIIGDGVVTAPKINVVNLAAIKAALGTVTSGKVQSTDGKTYFDLTNGIIRIFDGTYYRCEFGKINGNYGGIIRDSAGNITVDMGSIMGASSYKYVTYENSVATTSQSYTTLPDMLITHTFPKCIALLLSVTRLDTRTGSADAAYNIFHEGGTTIGMWSGVESTVKQICVNMLIHPMAAGEHSIRIQWKCLSGNTIYCTQRRLMVLYWEVQ